MPTRKPEEPKIKRATFDPSEAALVSDVVSLSIDGTPGSSDAPTRECCDQSGNSVEWESNDSSEWTVEWSEDCTAETGGATANLSTNTVGEKHVKATVTITWTCPETDEETETEIALNRDFKVVNVSRPSISGMIWYLGGADLGLSDYKQKVQHTLTPTDAPITIEATKGASKVTIGEAISGLIAVNAASTPSSMVNDVELSLKHDGKKFTEKKFHHTVVLFEMTMVYKGPVYDLGVGFTRTTSWKVEPTIDNMAAFPAAIGINESFESRVDHMTNDWTWTPNGKDVEWDDREFNDVFRVSGPYDWVPAPVNPGAPGSTTPVCSLKQNYKVGSQTIGTGAIINTKTLHWTRGGIDF